LRRERKIVETNTKQPEFSPAMRGAVERLYAVFGSYRAPRDGLDACTYCCMDPKLEAEMLRMPLRQITAHHFYEYNCAAKGPEQPVDEVKYLLPRMMELLASGVDIHHSMELAIQRLGSSDAAQYSAQEREAIDAFALCYFSEILGRHPWLGNEACLGDDAFTVLLMFHYGGIALAPLLELWLRDNCLAATLHYADASYSDFWMRGEFKKAFAKDQLDYCETIKEWLLNPENCRQFANRIMVLDPDVLGENGECRCCYGMTAKEVLGAVFDLTAEHMTASAAALAK